MKEIIINGQQISRVLKDGKVVWSKDVKNISMSEKLYKDSRDRHIDGNSSNSGSINIS